MPDIIIADRLSNANQKLIPNVGGLQVSWEISKAGQLTCDVTARELTALGINPSTLMSKWLHYTHPTAGPWGGQIQNVGGAGTGVITINAESWASCLRGVTTDGNTTGSTAVTANLGRLIDINAALTGIARTASSIVSGGAGFNSVDALAVGQDMYEQFIPAVLEYFEQGGGAELPRPATQLRRAAYNVDPATRVFAFSPTFGVDRSTTVSLVDGLHNVHSEWSDDLSDVVNRVIVQAKNVISQRVQTGVKKNKKGKKVPVYKQVTRTVEDARIGVDQASIDRYGRRSLLMVLDRTFPSPAVHQNFANAIAQDLAANNQLVTCETVDEGGVWATFREGDEISVSLGNSGVSGRMVVRMRALDMTRGTMLVSGEAVLT